MGLVAVSRRPNVTVHTHVSDLPQGFEPVVRARLAKNPFVCTGRNLTRYARSIPVAEAVTDAGCRAISDEFGLTQVLNGHCKVCDGQFNFFMSLYRRGDAAPFTETENADFLAVLRHIEQATSVCLRFDLGMRVDPNTGWALVDHTGELFLFSTGFADQTGRTPKPGQKPANLQRAMARNGSFAAQIGVVFTRKRFSDDLWLVTVSPPSPWAGLSKREHLVANCLVQGMTMRQAAETLEVSVNTVRNQVNSIYRKTDVRNRTQFLRLANADRAIKSPETGSGALFHV